VCLLYPTYTYNVVLSNAGVISTHPLHTYVKEGNSRIVSLIRSQKQRKKNSDKYMYTYIYVCMSSMFKHKHTFLFRGSLIMVGLSKEYR
jgi:hypothetical protein